MPADTHTHRNARTVHTIDAAPCDRHIPGCTVLAFVCEKMTNRTEIIFDNPNLAAFKIKSFLLYNKFMLIYMRRMCVLYSMHVIARLGQITSLSRAHSFICQTSPWTMLNGESMVIFRVVYYRTRTKTINTTDNIPHLTQLLYFNSREYYTRAV